MNDEQLEYLLRTSPARELPPTWRAEILDAAARAGFSPKTARISLVVFIRNLIARNPYTTATLATLWMLIFLFHATTPVDPAADELLARVDPTKPVHVIDLAKEMRLVESLQELETPPAPRVP